MTYETRTDTPPPRLKPGKAHEKTAENLWMEGASVGAWTTLTPERGKAVKTQITRWRKKLPGTEFSLYKCAGDYERGIPRGHYVLVRTK